MNFTREPIIETVITPREGCKLLIRNSKGGTQEEYSVEAVEVISFGHSLFFRSLERTKAFLVPVSDYEIFEVKEARVPLKSPGIDRSIKISSREPVREPPEEEPLSPRLIDRKRDRRRSRRRGRGREEETLEYREPLPQEEPPAESLPPSPEMTASLAEEPKTPSFISKLFPPPSTLIKETLSRYKPPENGEPTEEKPTPFEESTFEPPMSPEPEEESEEETRFED